MTAVIESYIEIDDNRVAWIANTRIKGYRNRGGQTRARLKPRRSAFSISASFDGANPRRTCLLL